MADQEPGMEKVSGGGGGGRRKGGLRIPVKGGVGVGVAILVFGTAAAAAAIGAVVRARRARREDRTTKRSFDEDEDNKRIGEGAKEEQEEEENASTISQRREKMGEEIEEASFQIDRENQYLRREDAEIVAIAEEEEIILKVGNDGDCDRKNSKESKVISTEVKIFEEAYKKKDKEEDNVENEKVEYEVTTESSIEETVDGSNGDSRASFTESGVFETVAEVIERKKEDETEEIEKRIANTSNMANGFSGNKREAEWKLEDGANKVSREDPEEIEISSATNTIVMMHESAIGFAIANRLKGGLLMISAFVLTIVLLLFVRRDRLGVFQLSTV